MLSLWEQILNYCKKTKKITVLQPPALVWELGKDSREVEGPPHTLVVALGTVHPKGEHLACRRFRDDENHSETITSIIINNS